MDFAVDAEMAAHLAGCAACRDERERREELRHRLRDAVRKPMETAALEQLVRTRSRRNGGGYWVMAAAAAVVAGLVGWGAYEKGYSPFGNREQEEFLASVSGQVSHVMRVGLVDHLHCTVFRKWAKPAPPLEEVVKEMDPKYRPVALLVSQQMPPGYQMFVAHQCRAGGRRFIHLSLRNEEGKVISLIVTRRQDGETFGGAPYATAHRFQLAGFETTDFLGYVISDLDEAENRQIAQALAGPVAAFLQTVG
ncbi:MAG TPA: hypothetical protein VFQ91_23585 [Bryobacteraceae bacterium]|nr:hypothetical protein [Bryobacteraceae bacterium]